jgi:putative nucleotidyltransferase with HDIG domain
LGLIESRASIDGPINKLENLRTRMQSLPGKAQAYIIAVLIGAVLLFLWSLPVIGGGDMLYHTIAIITFALGIFVADLYPLRLVTDANAEVTVSCALKTAVAIIYGPAVAIVATLLGTAAAELGIRRDWFKAAFNTAEMVITTAAMAVVYQWGYDGIDVQPFHSPQNAAAVIAMVLTYLFINTGLVTGIVALVSGARFTHVWKANFFDSLWNNLTIILLGAVLATLYIYRPWSVVALVLPLVVMRKSFAHIAEFKRQTQQALVNMADAIDQRDPSTYTHSQRVADIAAAIAQEMGLPEDEVETIRMAARLHDLGKIGMSNELLFKPSSLDPQELGRFQQHPLIGAQLVNSFRFFEEGELLIRHHHERYDGEGYPSRLVGEDIPLGSRILAVADSFDAMTSHRTYRPALSTEEAITEVVANKGSQFDPEVVDAFLMILRRRANPVPSRQTVSSAAGGS